MTEKAWSHTCVVRRTEKKRESQRDRDRESTHIPQSSEMSEAQLSLVLYDFSPSGNHYNLV